MAVESCLIKGCCFGGNIFQLFGFGAVGDDAVDQVLVFAACVYICSRGQALVDCVDISLPCRLPNVAVGIPSQGAGQGNQHRPNGGSRKPSALKHDLVAGVGATFLRKDGVGESLGLAGRQWRQGNLGQALFHFFHVIVHFVRSNESSF